MLQAMAALLQPVEFSADDLALEAQKQVPPGGIFLAPIIPCNATAMRFYAPFLSDWRNNQAWQEAGGRTAQDRATDIWQEMLETYEKPGLPIERIEAINDFVARRKEQIGESEISG